MWKGVGWRGCPCPGWHSAPPALASPQAQGAQAAELSSDESAGAGAKA